MKRKFAWSFLMFLAACAGSVAQEPTGKFTFSHDSHWGTAVLPAGTYVVSVHSGPVPFVTVTSQDRNAVSIMAVAEYLELTSFLARHLRGENVLDRLMGTTNIEQFLAAFAP